MNIIKEVLAWADKFTERDSQGTFVEDEACAVLAAEVRRLTGEVARLTEMHSDLCLDTCAKNRHLAKAWVDKAAALARAEAAVEERDELREWKQDMIDTHRQIVSEQCAPDEKHCSCVPALRGEIELLRDKVHQVRGRSESKLSDEMDINAELTATIDTLRRQVDEWADKCVKAEAVIEVAQQWIGDITVRGWLEVADAVRNYYGHEKDRTGTKG